MLQADHSTEARPGRWAVAIVMTAVAVHCLNDFLYIGARSDGQWLAADYGSKTLVLALLLSNAELRRFLAAHVRPRRFGALDLALMIAAIAFELSSAALAEYLNTFAPSTALFKYWRIESLPLYMFDMFFGLALNAVAEELLGRGAFAYLAERWRWPSWAYVAISSVVFAFAHWSNGVGPVTTALIFGIGLAVLFVRTRSLALLIFVHYAVNFIGFG